MQRNLDGVCYIENNLMIIISITRFIAVIIKKLDIWAKASI